MEIAFCFELEFEAFYIVCVCVINIVPNKWQTNYD